MMRESSKGLLSLPGHYYSSDMARSVCAFPEVG